MSLQRVEALRQGRSLPHSIECEASILGGIIVRNECLAVVPSLEIDDFYDPKHRVIFEAIRNLEAKKSPIDIATLEAEIERSGKLDAVGGIAFLGELALRVPTVDNVEAYAKVVTDHAITRNVIFTLADRIDDAFSGEAEGEQLVADTASSLMHIRTGGEVPIMTIGEAAEQEAIRVRADLDAKAEGKLVYAGVPTGFYAIDERVGGNPIGVMTMYIARPAMGKSTVAMHMAQASKRIADDDTLIVSWEDGKQPFGQRALAQESGISTECIRARKINPDERGAFRRGAVAAIQRGELFMEAHGLGIEQAIRRIRREQIRRKSEGKKPIRQVIFDYIQRVPMPEWARSREEGIGHISRSLANFAGQDELAVVALSQLNRESEKRDDHRPRLSDIRDSGSLEQDAKLIVGLYHPWNYDRKHDESQYFLLVLKNAQGEGNLEIELYWDRPRHSLYDSYVDYQRARAERGI